VLSKHRPFTRKRGLWAALGGWNGFLAIDGSKKAVLFKYSFIDWSDLFKNCIFA